MSWIKEETSGIFRKTIEIPVPFLGTEIMRRVEEICGEDFHRVRYYRDADYYVIGRRRGFGLGSDIILVNSHLSPDLLLWNASREYKSVTVCDGSWNDGEEIEPPIRTANHPHDVTIESCLVFAKELERILMQMADIRIQQEMFKESK